MAQLNPYLTFNGNCREAMTFYMECLGGELTLMPIEGTPAEAQCPAGMKHQIMHSELRNSNLVLMATDMVSPAGYHHGTTMAMSLNCSSEEEINDAFAKLSAGGNVIDPLKDQFWGGKFGVAQDKFGMTWLFNYQKPQQ